MEGEICVVLRSIAKISPPTSSIVAKGGKLRCQKIYPLWKGPCRYSDK